MIPCVFMPEAMSWCCWPRIRSESGDISEEDDEDGYEKNADSHEYEMNNRREKTQMDQIQVRSLRDKAIDIEKCLTTSSTFTLFLSFSFFGCLFWHLVFFFCVFLPTLQGRCVSNSEGCMCFRNAYALCLTHMQRESEGRKRRRAARRWFFSSSLLILCKSSWWRRACIGNVQIQTEKKENER